MIRARTFRADLELLKSTDTRRKGLSTSRKMRGLERNLKSLLCFDTYLSFRRQVPFKLLTNYCLLPKVIKF
jgi:hypothetical protein